MFVRLNDGKGAEIVKLKYNLDEKKALVKPLNLCQVSV